VTHELDDESWHSLSMLYALGFTDRADPLFARLSPLMAASFFETTERIDLALEAFGLDPQNPDYAALIRRDFDKFLDDPRQADAEASRLFALAGFLESRGRGDLLLDHYLAPLQALGQRDAEEFIEALGELFSAFMRFPVATPVVPAVVAFAGEDAGRWQMVLATMFGETELASEVWESLARFSPGISPKLRLELMMGLFGRVPGHSETCQAWWDWMEKQADAADGVDAQARYRSMLALAVVNTDAERFVKIAEQARRAGQNLGELEGEYEFQQFEMWCFAALHRWDRVADYWQQKTSVAPTSPVIAAYAAGASRQAGLTEQADALDRRVEVLALGASRTMREIGRAYAAMGWPSRARTWWRRSIAATVGSDEQLIVTVFLLYEEAKFAADWSLAAAMGEAMSLFLIMRGDTQENPMPLARARHEIEMARALAMLDTDRVAALRKLSELRGATLSDGSMADYFFPALRRAKLTKLHDEWFEETWTFYQGVLRRFPKSHNTMNTAAWTASRASRRLDEAAALVERALELAPGQAA
jgi:hypothetical protein